MTSFRVICALGFPQSKILGTPIIGDRLKKIFEDLLFLGGERLHRCPWSLALASSIPVLGLKMFCPRKGCPWPWPRTFLCPWPWPRPRALCPRLHLCYEPHQS